MTDATQPRMARGTMLSAGLLAAALLALLAFAPFASAASDPVAGGSTTVTLKQGFVKSLKNKGVTIQKVSPAKLKGNKATFTVTGGELDPTTGLGTVTLGGGVKFKAGKRTAAVKSLVIDTSKKSLTAKVAGKKMKFATLAGYTYTRDGFGLDLTIKKLKLTSSAANKLNQKLGYTGKGKGKGGKASSSAAAALPFKGGRLFGSASGETQPSTVAVLPTGNATLALSASAVKKLAHVGTPPYPEGFSPVAVKLSPVAPTTVVSEGPPPTVAFPISGGTIGPAANAGTLQTAGGLKLVQDLSAVSADPENITTLTMGNIWVDLATKQASVEVIIENPKTPAANLGNLGRASIADISLVGATVTADPATRTISVQNASATLQAVTAETLNQVFIEGLEKANPAFVGQEKFAAGDPLGTFSFTAQTQ